MDPSLLDTIINKKEFVENVELFECPYVGRSLLAKRDLVPGQVIMVEKPLIKYPLEPQCRSHASPFYTKALWKSLVDIVNEEEGCNFKASNNGTGDSDSSNNDSSDSDSDSDSSDSSDSDSSKQTPTAFSPGIPAALLAYLSIELPPKSYRPHTDINLDFFYYPDSQQDEWADHTTLQLVTRIVERVQATHTLFQHIEAKALISFILKIYCNAHTVAHPRFRTAPTHSHKKERRANYSHKWSVTDYAWTQELPGPQSYICLLRWGSKYAHSCAPSMFLRFDLAQQAMVFTMMRPVKAGQLLTFSYLPEDDLSLGGLLCGSTLQRQAKLSIFKFFSCHCVRCIYPDWICGVDCTACSAGPVCQLPTGVWECQACHSTIVKDQSRFLVEREAYVEKMIMSLAHRAYGVKPMGESVMRVLEPYLMDLLEKDGVVLPKYHWTYSTAHALLAIYHLKLFPGAFGKGLASRLGMFDKGLREASVYIGFLNDNVWNYPIEATEYYGSRMAALVAGWRIIEPLVDVVMDSTEEKQYAFTKEESSSDSDSDTQVQAQAPFLIPMPKEWEEPIRQIIDVVCLQWIPVANTLFQHNPPALVQEIIDYATRMHTRIDALDSLDLKA
ncbi:hypothetical protein BDF14DRAFT_1735024 [Spinellus fusiger]|nr:hypothetical protein BDF14DRAFT_1735024 [Spinellus fusiger]